jgi:hypothetical protein
MNYTLHKLPEGFIVTSDEEIKEGCSSCYDTLRHHITSKCIEIIVKDIHRNDYLVFEGNTGNPRDTYKKIIAQQDQIDFSLVKDKITDCKFPVNVTGNFENGVFRIQSIIGKEYEIPIVWESYKRYKVEANNLEEAVTKALKQFLSEPDDEYIEDSFSIDDIIYDENPDEDFHIHKIYNSL